MNLKRRIPAIEWISSYSKSDFRFDLVAGITVGVMLVPQGMAYALLAGVPPIYGLYAGIVPLVLYALLGTSRHLSIGPVAVSALLIYAGVGQVAEPFSEEYLSLVILTGFLIGIAQTLMSFLRLGFLVNFLSHPVIAGFTSAAAVIIAASQLKYLLGISIPPLHYFYETIIYAMIHISETNFWALGLGIGGMILISVLKKLNKNIPGALLAVIIGIALVYIFQLQEKGISIVGDVPRGLPKLIFPEFSIAKIQLVLPTVFTVTLIGIVESIGIAKAIEAKHDYYKVRPNQELFALGISKIVGSFFQSIPTSGSFSRSAINNESGGRTGFSSIITAALISITLLFLMPLFFYLPEALLASIILLAVKGLFEYKEAIRLWKIHRNDFWMMMVTFVVTLGVGIELGVLTGVVLSVLQNTYLSSKPPIIILGKIPGTDYFRNVERFPEALQNKEILILRFDSPLYFPNADFFKKRIYKFVKQREGEMEVLILDASSILTVDSTGIHAMEEVVHFLKSKGIDFYISGALGLVRDRFTKAGLMRQIGPENQFMIIQDAVNAFDSRDDDSIDIWTSLAVQSNEEEE